MVPMLQPENGSERIGAGQVSLQALTEPVVLLLLMFAGAMLLLLLTAMVDAAFKLARLT